MGQKFYLFLRFCKPFSRSFLKDLSMNFLLKSLITSLLQKGLIKNGVVGVVKRRNAW